jgi:hypothetical protein
MQGARAHRRSWLPVAAQLLLACGATAGAIAAPPARGAMLIVPLAARSTGSSLALAQRHGALLLGRGPVAGSLIVAGDRRRLLPSLLAQGMLVTAAPAGWCRA